MKMNAILRPTLTGTAALLFLLTFSTPDSCAQEQGIFTDTRDNESYHWIRIGHQVWMAENLKFVDPVASWAYNNDPSMASLYGRHYTWKSAGTSCPKGWRLPSAKDWDQAIRALGGAGVAGEKFMAMDTVGQRRDEIELSDPDVPSTMLSGVRYSNGSCLGINTWGGCWTSDESGPEEGINFLVARKRGEITQSSNDKASGFSVRCVRNK